MKWTKKKPTEPGYYWWRQTPTSKHYAIYEAHGWRAPVTGEWWPEPIEEPLEDESDPDEDGRGGSGE